MNHKDLEGKNFDTIQSLLSLSIEKQAIFQAILDQIVLLRIESSPDLKKEEVFDKVEKNLTEYRERALEFLIPSKD